MDNSIYFEISNLNGTVVYKDSDFFMKYARIFPTFIAIFPTITDNK